MMQLLEAAGFYQIVYPLARDSEEPGCFRDDHCNPG